MRTLSMFLLGMAFLLAACSSEGPAVDSAAPSDPAATPTVVIPSLAPDPSPTPVLVPTIVADSSPTATVVADGDDADDAQADPTATAVVVPTSTPRPIPTASPTAVPTVAPTAVVVRPTPRPIQPTATPVWSTPVPTTGWVNPDCYVGPGAADEPVWWCGGKICWVNAPHYGCPTTPPVPQTVEVGCTISDRSIMVNDVITLRAWQDPVNVPVVFAFEHGDGTLDRTSESRAFYAAPGSYDVIMRWNLGLQGGRIFCGTVVVTSENPNVTPTVVPSLQIGCNVSDRNIVVNQVITLQATQSPANVPVAFVFDHGDGTLDATSRSRALYLAPGFYNVKLQWAHAGNSGVVDCGTVTVTPQFSAASYIGRSASSAEAFANSQGLTLRIVRVDAKNFPGTTDYRPDRVNVEVDNGAVTKAYLG